MSSVTAQGHVTGGQEVRRQTAARKRERIDGPRVRNRGDEAAADGGPRCGTVGEARWRRRENEKWSARGLILEQERSGTGGTTHLHLGERLRRKMQGRDIGRSGGWGREMTTTTENKTATEHAESSGRAQCIQKKRQRSGRDRDSCRCINNKRREKMPPMRNEGNLTRREGRPLEADRG